jgi:SAM-dependent methyltransferase
MCTVGHVPHSQDEPAEQVEVNAQDVSRMSGVTKGAVSNWRRRFSDFPQPVGGTPASPTFALREVEAWLRSHGKAVVATEEVELWHHLRTVGGGDVTSGLAIVSKQLAAPDATGAVADKAAELIKSLVSERGARQLFEDLHSRYVASSSRRTGTSGQQFASLVAGLLGDTPRSVLDPACGTGNLLMALSNPTVALYGQDVDTVSVDIARARGVLSGRQITARCGDSLRHDAFGSLKVDSVVCEPPAALREWGREELMYDPRWKFGLPTNGESDLAWVQHCYAHLAPAGTAVVALSPAAAARRSGRRIRSELLRHGVLKSVVALPGGFAVDHPHPLHLWILTHPGPGRNPFAAVEMVDAAASPGGTDPLNGARNRSVPVVELLDDEVDLTPARHMVAPVIDVAAEAAELACQLRAALLAAVESIPRFAQGEPEFLPARSALSELAAAGVVAFGEHGRWHSDPAVLDPDFVAGFLRSPENRRRQTSATGVHRVDPRSALIPRVPVERQRLYAGAFRDIAAFRASMDAIAQIAGRLADSTSDGLTTGALEPQVADIGNQAAPSTGDARE